MQLYAVLCRLCRLCVNSPWICRKLTTKVYKDALISLWTCLIYLIKMRTVISIWKNLIKTCLTLCIPFEISIWKKCSSNGLKKTFNTDPNSKKYGAFCQQIPTPFQIKIHLQTPLCFFVIMAFFEVNVYNYQKDVPSRKCIISWKTV